MWRGVNQPESQSLGMSGLDGGPRDNIFRAYTDPRRVRVPRRLLLLPVAALGVLGLFIYWAVTFEPAATPFRVDTYKGLRTVLSGMSPQEVSGILGQPIGRERRGEQECFQYGRPSLRVESYLLQTVCYEGGKLRAVHEQRYNSWVITQDGAITPAPLLPEAPEEPAAPAPPAPPGVATPGTP